jgi:hypothetical protein
LGMSYACSLAGVRKIARCCFRWGGTRALVNLVLLGARAAAGHGADRGLGVGVRTIVVGLPIRSSPRPSSLPSASPIGELSAAWIGPADRSVHCACSFVGILRWEAEKAQNFDGRDSDAAADPQNTGGPLTGLDRLVRLAAVDLEQTGPGWRCDRTLRRRSESASEAYVPARKAVRRKSR